MKEHVYEGAGNEWLDGLLSDHKSPLLYLLLVPSKVDSTKITRVATSLGHNSRGYRCQAPEKPISKVFRFAGDAYAACKHE